MGKKNRKSGAPKRARVAYVDRPFEGLTGEADLVAMRELLPAASAKARTNAEYGSQDVLFVTVLPNMAPALRRNDGLLLIGMQTQAKSGDVSRDYAAAIEAGLELEPGNLVGTLGLLEPGARLQDILDPEVTIAAELHQDFSFWLEDDAERTEDLNQALEESAQGMVPSERVDGVEGAFWCSMNHEFVRWVYPGDEDALWDALARLQAEGKCNLGEGSRFVGAFRSYGVLVPVWELADNTGAQGVAKPLAELSKRLEAALQDDSPLSADARRARAGMVSRQVTLR